MKKKVLFIINALGGGGAERALTTLLDSELFKEKLEVHLILLENKVKYPVPNYVNIHIATKLGESASRGEKIASLSKMINFVKKIKKEVNPDVSISYLTRSNIINVLTGAGNGKVFISERNNPVKTYGNNPVVKFVHRGLISHFYSRADGVISVSEGVRKSLISYINIDESKVITINNPYDIDRIEKLAGEGIEKEFENIFREEPVLITVGRLTRQKGQDCLIEAIPEVLKSHKVQVMIIGEGELKPSLEKKAEESNISHRVHFVGWRENPFKYIKRSAVFVLPSRWEGFPNALVEAMACGCPVVASNCESGPLEILEHNEFGFLTKVDDPHDLAEKINKLLDDKEKMKDYGVLAKKRAACFHKERIAEEYLKLIDG